MFGVDLLEVDFGVEDFFVDDFRPGDFCVDDCFDEDFFVDDFCFLVDLPGTTVPETFVFDVESANFLFREGTAELDEAPVVGS